eukprot:scaffold19138_cov29-Tisochrysis_lutea.AAC.1
MHATYAAPRHSAFRAPGLVDGGLRTAARFCCLSSVQEPAAALCPTHQPALAPFAFRRVHAPNASSVVLRSLAAR